MKHSETEEWFPIVDENGNTIGQSLREVCHNGKSKLLHPVVHLHLFNRRGYLFLQKRSLTKDIQPGKWDTSVGGHISFGEKVEEALIREPMEEIGLKDFIPKSLGTYIWESSIEREYVNSFYTITDDSPTINNDEVDDGKFWNQKEIKQNLTNGIFTPNFIHEFETLLFKLKIR